MKKETRNKLLGPELSLVRYLSVNYSKLGTPALLERLRMIRATQSMGFPYGTDHFWSELDELTEECKVQLNKIVTALKRELAKRPHLPNAKERKEIRKKKAQGKYVVE